MDAVIFDITRNSFVDGPGIRTTVFFKGCNLRCAWCHNPESQNPNPQMMFYKDKCKGCGMCKAKCPNHLESCTLCGICEMYCMADARKICGKTYTVEEVLKEVLKDKSFYEHSGGGVTFSGGECMLQTSFLVEILKACKDAGLHTAVDTAGHVSWDKFEQVLSFTDLFLYDVKSMNSRVHKEYVGVGNELILENLSKLLDEGAKVWIRMPVIGGVNDSEEEILALKEFLGKQKTIPEKIELLPYHAMGEHKYSALDMEKKEFSVPSKEKMEYFNQLLQ
ncbi:MAG: glycyl-radical enzyme activating protein [Lachnospiraceae bacterium]|nr:glycyl-radical enzyme activating protein [Lachnospiraceae bacterium]